MKKTGGGLQAPASHLTPILHRLKRRSDDSTDHGSEKRSEADTFVALVVMHHNRTRRRRRGQRVVYDHGTRRRWRRVVHHDRRRTRRRRGMMHDRRRTVMRGGMIRDGPSAVRVATRRLAVLRCPRRRRLMSYSRPCGGPSSVAAARSGESGSAERDASETRDQKLVDVVVHATPLSTFLFRCYAGAHLPLT